MTEKDKPDPKHSEVIRDPNSPINQPEWTDKAVGRSVETEGPNAGTLMPEAAWRHGEFMQSDKPEHADYYEFEEAIRAAVGFGPEFFANPDISEEEAVDRLVWARGRARAAVNQARLIQKTAGLAAEEEGATANIDTPPEPEPEKADTEEVNEEARTKAEAEVKAKEEAAEEIGSKIEEAEVEKTEEAELREKESNLESAISAAGSVDEVKAAIIEFDLPIRGPYVKYSVEALCALIDKLQQEGIYWARFIPERYGILGALKRILAPSMPAIANLQLESEKQAAQEAQASKEKQEIFSGIEKEPVYVEHGEGCVGNLQHALDRFADQHQELLGGIKGKRVLIKINAVDPSSPDACTSAEALRATVENLLRYEPAEICIGDQPAGHLIEDEHGQPIDSEELFRRFKEQLGYDFLDQYPTVRFIDFRSELSAPSRVSPDEARIYDLSGFESVFVLSLPKAHGQLGFSGCRKNLVGLLPQDERKAILHSGPIEQWKKSNTAGMRKVSESYTARNPKTVYILDGYQTLMGHEHDGVPRVTDYSIVSMDAFTTDLVASSTSFSPDLIRKIGYLRDIPFKPLKSKIEGGIPVSADKSFNESRLVAARLRHDERGTLVFSHETVIDPEIDEITVKPIEEVIERARSVEDISDIDSVLEKLGKVGSDRAIACLLRIADMTDNLGLLGDIYCYIEVPVKSSRGLKDSDEAPSAKTGDELVDGFYELRKKVMGH